MYEVHFYQDANGNQPVKEYLDKLEEKSIKSKDARIKYNKIDQYIGILMEHGTAAGEPYVKHLDGEIWELRPLKNRFLYAYYKDNKFIVLHHFIKKTQKTPKHEIEQAKRNLKDYLERNE